MLAELCMDAAGDASAGRGASFQPQQENLHAGSAQVRFKHRLAHKVHPHPSSAHLFIVSQASREGQA